jgi:hypothetical protein
MNAKHLMVFAAIVLAAALAHAAEDDTKTLFDFESGTQGWWTFSNDAKVELAAEAGGAADSAKALKATYKFGGAKAHLGIGNHGKNAMGKDPWAPFAGGHLRIALKSDSGCAVRIELRSADKSTYAVSLPSTSAAWAEYSIPFAEFTSGEKAIDLAAAVIDQIVIMPVKKDSKEHTLWIDNLAVCKTALQLPRDPFVFSVSGKVCDAAGKALAETAVSLMENNSLTAHSQTATNAEGTYALSRSLPPRKFAVNPAGACPEPAELALSICAQKAGFVTHYATAKLQKGANTCDIALATAKLPPELRVAGNQLQTADGKAVWLQGVCVDSLQWSATGDHLLQSLPVAVEQWKASIIRLPVNDEFWFGRGQWQRDKGAYYRKLVETAIDAVASRGAYVALDLHRFGAPMPAHAEFWKEVAAQYKNHPAVLFELFNEAHGISWELWRDGGELKNAKHKDVNAAENDEKASGPVSVGMQKLVDTVRAAGANNIVIAGGLDWGYDLAGIMEGFALQEREGNGIMYSSHVYPWKSDWQGKTLVAAEKHPLFIGEVGCQPKPMPWQKTTEDPATWAPDVIGMIQTHKLNWTGFSFHPTCGPNVIQDWQYTPTPYWGAYVKEALAGKTFELKKLR